MRLIVLDKPEEVVTKVLFGPFFLFWSDSQSCSVGLIKVLQPGLGYKPQHQTLVYGYSLSVISSPTLGF